MLYLRNEQLTLAVIDPIKDADRIGPRFCTGGYIYQVEDRQARPLLSGPEYPKSNPSVINGQGLPEVFQHTLYRSEAEIAEKKLVIGVGLVDNSERATPLQTHFHSRLEEYCRWALARDEERIAMETTQAYGDWSLSISKEISLAGRTVTSSTRLRNRGAVEFRFRWFAHPFFPIPNNYECCRFSLPLEIPKNPGFQLNSAGYVTMKPAYEWEKGHFQILEGTAGKMLSARERHPLVGEIIVECDFPLHRLALWANSRTFSFEPFHSLLLTPGQETRWSISYKF